MSNINSLAKVPDINFVNTDVNALLDSFVLAFEAAYQEATGTEKTLYPTDKERIWLYTAALIIYQALITTDLEAKQNFLKYAKGSFLDNIGATRHSLVRSEAQFAKVSIKFTLSQALTENKIIPVGTRVTAGDNVFFTVNENKIIAAGQTEGNFVFQCTEAGVIGNNYAIGAINTLVDPIPFVQSIENTEISQGGADLEDDDTFTEEIWEAPEGYAVAGPEEAYIYRAKQFSQAIEDVVAYSPDDEISFQYTYGSTTQTPTISTEGVISGASNLSSYDLNLSTGEIELHFATPVSVFKGTFPRGGIVNIVPLLQNATIPNETFLNELKTFLSDDKYRPLTDLVQTLPPEAVEYTINFKYWVDAADTENLTEIQTNIAAAVQTYIAWQDTKLSRDINPDELTYLVKNAGAKRLEITTPVYTKLENIQIAKHTTQSINYEGLEE